MVVAYLRGLLPRRHKFGRRSFATEEIILESLSAEAVADNMETSLQVDLALIPVLTQKGATQTLTRVGARLGRASELRLLDIYKVAEQLESKNKVTNRQNELSLFQLYHLAEKTGIFEAFDAHYTDDKFKPIL